MAITIVSKKRSTPQNTYSGGYHAAETASVAEESKRKENEEYKKIIKETNEAGKEIIEAYTDLNSAKRALALYSAGNSSNNIRNGIEKAQDAIEKNVNEMNSITERVKEKIRENGEIVEKEKLKTNYERNYVSSRTTGFNCNTERIREEVLIPLQSAQDRLRNASNIGSRTKTLRGGEDVKKVLSEIEDEEEKISKLYKEVENLVENAEKIDNQNKMIINSIGTRTSTIRIEPSTRSTIGISMTPISKPNTYINNEDISETLKKIKEQLENQKQGTTGKINTPSPTSTPTRKTTTSSPTSTPTRKTTTSSTKTTTQTKTTTTSTGTSKTNKGFGEIPLYNQLDYPHVALGSGNIRSGGCGPTSLAMLGSAATGQDITPDVLMEMHPEIANKYIKGSGVADSVMQNEKILDDLNLKLEGNYYYQEAWTEGKLMEALENGCVAIWKTKNENFTKGGHYIVIAGITEDGKLILNDPNGESYMSNNPVLVEGFANGFDPKKFATYGGNFYVYSLKDPNLVKNPFEETTPSTRTTSTPTRRTTITNNKSDTSAYWDSQKNSTTRTSTIGTATTTKPKTATRTSTSTSTVKTTTTTKPKTTTTTKPKTTTTTKPKTATTTKPTTSTRTSTR